jgi:hypothetical protein
MKITMLVAPLPPSPRATTIISPRQFDAVDDFAKALGVSRARVMDDHRGAGVRRRSSRYGAEPYTLAPRHLAMVEHHIMWHAQPSGSPRRWQRKVRLCRQHVGEAGIDILAVVRRHAAG